MNTRKRARVLKEKLKIRIQSMLYNEDGAIEAVSAKYRKQIKRIRRECSKKIVSNEKQFYKYKKAVYDEMAQMMKNKNQVFSQLKSKIIKCTELSKELIRRDLSDFKLFVEEYDKKDEKLEEKQIHLLENMQTGLTDEELALVEQFVDMQTRDNETQYQSQLEALNLPEQMRDILSNISKEKEKYEKVKQQEDEWNQFFDEIFAYALNDSQGEETLTDSQKLKSQQVLMKSAMEMPKFAFDSQQFKLNNLANCGNDTVALEVEKLTTTIQEIKQDVEFTMDFDVPQKAEDTTTKIDDRIAMPPPTMLPIRLTKKSQKPHDEHKCNVASSLPISTSSNKDLDANNDFDANQTRANEYSFDFEKASNKKTIPDSELNNFTTNFDHSNVKENKEEGENDNGQDDDFAFDFAPFQSDAKQDTNNSPDFMFDFGNGDTGDEKNNTGFVFDFEDNNEDSKKEEDNSFQFQFSF